jgi:hypothetical protein
VTILVDLFEAFLAVRCQFLRLPYHVYAEEKKEKGKRRKTKRGKKERIQNFLDV